MLLTRRQQTEVNRNRYNRWGCLPVFPAPLESLRFQDNNHRTVPHLILSRASSGALFLDLRVWQVTYAEQLYLLNAPPARRHKVCACGAARNLARRSGSERVTMVTLRSHGQSGLRLRRVHNVLDSRRNNCSGSSAGISRRMPAASQLAIGQEGGIN